MKTDCMVSTILLSCEKKSNFTISCPNIVNEMKTCQKHLILVKAPTLLNPPKSNIEHQQLYLQSDLVICKIAFVHYRGLQNRSDIWCGNLNFWSHHSRAMHTRTVPDSLISYKSYIKGVTCPTVQLCENSKHLQMAAGNGKPLSGYPCPWLPPRSWFYVCCFCNVNRFYSRGPMVENNKGGQILWTIRPSNFQEPFTIIYYIWKRQKAFNFSFWLQSHCSVGFKPLNKKSLHLRCLPIICKLLRMPGKLE